MAGVDLKKIKQAEAEKKSTTSSSSISQLLNKDISFGSVFNDKKKEEFYQGFGSMLSSGLDVKTSVDLLTKEQTKPKIKAIMENLQADLIKGNSLSEAMKASKAFSPYEYFSVQIGEETGKLVEVTEQLGSFYTSSLKQRRQFVSALSYPVLILLTSLGAVAFMLFFMVPMFSEVFKRFGGDLPGITKSVIGFSDFLSANTWPILLTIVGLVVFVLVASRKIWFQRAKDHLIIRIPFFGKIYESAVMARFCNTMGLLLGSKVPLIRCIDLIRQMISFYPLKDSFPQLKKDILDGESLHNSLSKNTLFSEKFITMVKIGEEVNQLDQFFNKLGSQYSSDLEHRTSLLNTFMEPLLIIFLGLIVGFILITMYLPMFQISTNMGI